MKIKLKILIKQKKIIKKTSKKIVKNKNMKK